MLEIGHIHSGWAVTLRRNTHQPAAIRVQRQWSVLHAFAAFLRAQRQESDCLNPHCTTPVRQIEFPDGAVFAYIEKCVEFFLTENVRTFQRARMKLRWHSRQRGRATSSAAV
jgi:hypothetical protein